MLSTVHAYLNRKKNEGGHTLGRMEQFISIKYPHLSMSDTKLSKIFKDPNSKVSMEELFAIVDSMGLDKREILAILGEQEYRDSESVGYKGAKELIADFARREEAQREHYEELLKKEAGIRNNINIAFTKAKEAFDHAVEVIQQNYNDTVSQLKQQLAIDAQEYHDAIASKDKSLTTMAEHAGAAMKSMKWWRAAAVTLIVTLSVAIIYLAWELRNLDKGATSILIDMVRQGLL